jgi:hypothetical protein
MRRIACIAILLAPLAVPAPAAAAWLWPVEGEVITPYRNGADPYAGGQHRGIDIAAAAGSPVRAPVAGTVTFSGTAGSSGLTVALRTADGRFDTSYLHLSATAVRKGDRVGAGARLGAVGTSGRRSATAPHLHFGVREAGSRHAYRDPLTLLPSPPQAPVREGPRGVPAPAPAPVRAAPRRERLPRVGPARRRVPVARRPRLPVRGRAPRGAPARPRLAPRPIAPVRAPRAVRGHERAPGRAPGPERVPHPAPASAPPEEPAVRRPAAAQPDAPGPDFGMIAACLGLLAAAACVGGRRGGEGDRRPSLLHRLRPLGGRR